MRGNMAANGRHRYAPLKFAARWMGVAGGRPLVRYFDRPATRYPPIDRRAPLARIEAQETSQDRGKPRELAPARLSCCLLGATMRGAIRARPAPAPQKRHFVTCVTDAC
jgi:hypothetical protein